MNAKPSYASLIRESRRLGEWPHIMNSKAVAYHIEAVVNALPKRTYSLVTDDRQTGWYDPGTGVRNDQTGLLMNDEPMSARRAERLLEELENPEVEL